MTTLTILPIRNLGFAVKSRTQPGVWWLVEIPGGCSCLATTPRCWHVQQVEAAARAENAKHARPVAPPAISALID